MSLQESQAKFRRLQKEAAAWQLLHLDNAPFILAFIEYLFSGADDVPFSKAKIVLEDILPEWREEFGTDDNATTHLRKWISAGWLLEYNDALSCTSACQDALAFANSLEKHDSTTTASHLSLVQTAVRELLMELNTDPKERIRALKKEIEGLKRQMKALRKGGVPELSDKQTRDRVRTIYTLASLLTGDFCRLEEEIRKRDNDLRVQMIDEEGQTGKILEAYLDTAQHLAATDAGQAFDGFFELLRDQDRTEEFREQIKRVLIHPASENYLSEEERSYLRHLVNRLMRESERVTKVRKQTVESLSAYIKSEAYQENKAIDCLLRNLEKTAISIKKHDISPRTPLNIVMNSGSVGLYSPSSIRLRMPEDYPDLGDIEESVDVPLDIKEWQALDSIRTMEVAENMRNALRKTNSTTLASLVNEAGITKGLEELVVYIRVAYAVSTPSQEENEIVFFETSNGKRLRARIPHIRLSSDMFPEKLEELSV